MKNYLLLTAVLFTFFSCDFNKSVKKDLITGLTTKGDGLSCDDVYLSDGTDKIGRTEFVYGEKFYLNFNDIKGFKKEGGFVFPGMQLIVLNKENDTVFIQKDLFEGDKNGFDLEPLLLSSNLIVAKPMHSNEEYALLINIWDKKGTGTFKAKMKFTVMPNNKLTIESNNLTYREIYLFSEEQGGIITDNSVIANEKLYLVFEGLDGFNKLDGKVFFGLKVIAKDSEGNDLLKMDDLFEDTGYDYADLHEILSANVVFSDENISNPIRCEFLVWDKRGDNNIKVTTELNLQ